MNLIIGMVNKMIYDETCKKRIRDLSRVRKHKNAGCKFNKDLSWLSDDNQIKKNGTGWISIKV